MYIILYKLYKYNINIIKLIVAMVAQLCEYTNITKLHILCSLANCMVCGLYLSVSLLSGGESPTSPCISIHIINL